MTTSTSIASGSFLRFFFVVVFVVVVVVLFFFRGGRSVRENLHPSEILRCTVCAGMCVSAEV